MENEINTFKELAAIDVSKYVKKKGKFDYLSWAWAVKFLREKYPGAFWEVKKFGEAQLPYIKDTKGCYVEVAVTVNNVTLAQIHPVLNHKNAPIFDPDAFQINTSIQRCLAKAIALHGLGIDLFANEDLPEENGNVTTPQKTYAKAPSKNQETFNPKILDIIADIEQQTDLKNAHKIAIDAVNQFENKEDTNSIWRAYYGLKKKLGGDNCD